MCDLFLKQDALSLLNGKSILLIGDSILRSVYKDLVWLCSTRTQSQLLPTEALVTKGEDAFLEDKLIEYSGPIKGRDYQEERDFYLDNEDLQITFLFVTKCYTEVLIEKLESYEKNSTVPPHAIIMNSALWDINRWGVGGMSCFKTNIELLMKTFRRILPKSTQVIWLTCPPLSTEVRGGILHPHLAFQSHSMRFNVMEANTYAARVVAAYGYDVIDLHYYCAFQLHRRVSDGIHWEPDAVRFHTNLLLTHLSISWKKMLPGNIDPGDEPQLISTLMLASKGTRIGQVQKEMNEAEAYVESKKRISPTKRYRD